MNNINLTPKTDHDLSAACIYLKLTKYCMSQG